MSVVRNTEPEWVLRQHMPHPVHDVSWYAPHLAGEPGAQPADLWLAAGDAQGQVSITWLPTYRPRAFWKAHDDAVLGVEMVDAETVVTQGRDNKLHVWRLPRGKTQSNASDLATRAAMANPRLPSSLRAALPGPERILSIDINALNYCRFSLVTKGRQLMVALPHTLESAYLDILHLDLDARQVVRAYSAIGAPDTGSAQAIQESRQAIVMAVQLFAIAPLECGKGKSKASEQGALYLLVGYEDGRITLWHQTHTTTLSALAKQEEARYQALSLYDSSDWQVVWTRAQHSDTVLSLSLSEDKSSACSTSADDVLAIFPTLPESSAAEDCSPTGVQVETSRPGRGCSALRSDAAVLAVGDWGGDVRLYDARTLREVSHERFFRQSVQALAFAPDLRATPISAQDGDGPAYTVDEPSDSEDDASDRDEPWRTSYDPRARSRRQNAYRWLAAGSKDGRIAIFDLTYLLPSAAAFSTSTADPQPS